MMMKEEQTTENTKAQMRKGLLEFCILLIISKEPAYASEILSELKRADLIVVEGTLYPLLTRLRSAGLLDYTWQESESGPPRKYYTLSKPGKENLATLKTTWKNLSQSINSLL